MSLLLSKLLKLSLWWCSTLLLLNQERLQSPRKNPLKNVQQSVEDPLLTAKLNFFLMIAKEIRLFLTKYQPDKPVLPFFATDMKNLVKGLLQKFNI